jgi:hypothetical protein
MLDPALQQRLLLLFWRELVLCPGGNMWYATMQQCLLLPLLLVGGVNRQERLDICLRLRLLLLLLK